jgi:hypothetical protein
MELRPASAVYAAAVLTLAACGVPEGGVCQVQAAAEGDCASGLQCCAIDGSGFGGRGRCRPEGEVCEILVTPTADAGAVDAGSADEDAGPVDGGVDAGPTEEDAGPEDAGPEDAGSEGGDAGDR